MRARHLLYRWAIPSPSRQLFLMSKDFQRSWVGLEQFFFKLPVTFHKADTLARWILQGWALGVEHGVQVGKDL